MCLFLISQQILIFSRFTTYGCYHPCLKYNTQIIFSDILSNIIIKHFIHSKRILARLCSLKITQKYLTFSKIFGNFALENIRIINYKINTSNLYPSYIIFFFITPPPLPHKSKGRGGFYAWLHQGGVSGGCRLLSRWRREVKT